MKIGVWTSDRVLAQDTITRLEQTELGEIYRRIQISSTLIVEDIDGNYIQWIRPIESARGYKVDKAYVDIQINTDIIFTVILPCLRHGGFEDIVWIAGERTTVYEYLHALPQPLFETILLGLMGFPINPEKEARFHDWMQRPYNEVFPACNLSALRSDATMPLDHMTILLGKTASTLPAERQEQMKNAMKNYCEVCDHNNNQIVDR